MARLALVVPVALLITLVLLFNAFGSLSLAVLTLLNVPFALRRAASSGSALAGHAAVGRRPRSASSRSSARRRSTACSCCPRSPSSARAGDAAATRPSSPAARERLRAGADDRRAGRARPGAGGDQPRHRQRDAATDRGGHRGRHAVGVRADAGRAAGDVPGVRPGDRAGAAQAAGVARAAGIRPGALTPSPQGTNAWTSA